MSYMSLSPAWCVICQNNVEFASHLFVQGSFATQFWNIILDAFGRSITHFINTKGILDSFLVGHPFGGYKKTIWLAIVRAFF